MEYGERESDCVLVMKRTLSTRRYVRCPWSSIVHQRTVLYSPTQKAAVRLDRMIMKKT
uniref:Uncharacterized protein n=1 Tax=Hyaloperonospora arabidopsidis (strain Emoy2) TaxID=559515 RepID=M4B8Y6_HYAAE